MYKRHAQGWTKHLDFMVIDIIILHVSFLLAYAVRHHDLPYHTQIYISLALIFSMADFISVMVFNLYHDILKRDFVKELSCSIKLSLSILLIVTTYMFLIQQGDAYSRITVVFTCLFHIPLGLGARLLWKQIVLRRNKSTGTEKKHTMLLVVDEDRAEEVISNLREHAQEGYAIVGVITREPSGRKEIAGLPVVCSLNGASEYICRSWIDSVYVDSPASIPEVAGFLRDCREMAVPTHYHIPGMRPDGAKQFVEKIGGATVLTTSINYATPLQEMQKRFLDITGGLIGGFLALIIMAIVGPIIKLKSPGPILFRQERIGQNGKIFKMMKIRSMYMDAEKRKQELLDQNRNKDGMMFKLDWDPRIIGNEILPDGTKKTGIGQFIRRTSLDEFPQFFNVLKGEMSLVGTRPPTVDEWNKYQFHHRARLACKPGITGLWQVSGRSNITDFEKVVALDTEYISNWSMAMDIRILMKTIRNLFTRRDAM